MVVRYQLLAPTTVLLVMDRKLGESQDRSGCKYERKAIFTSAGNGNLYPNYMLQVLARHPLSWSDLSWVFSVVSNDEIRCKSHVPSDLSFTVISHVWCDGATSVVADA